MNTLKIALIGYGKMGREVEVAAIARGHTVALVLDTEEDWKQNGHELTTCDVAIEFTSPEVAMSNIRRCFAQHIPVVTGTTGWYASIDQIREECLHLGGSLFYASNFSIGVNMFFVINRTLARLMDRFPDYDLSIEETHHIHKKDAPSGTAITLAEDCIHQLQRKTNWRLKEASTNESIEINSIRRDNVTGSHTVTYTSLIDSLSLTHHAINRQGFALGALMAAEFIAGKKGIFTMKDLLDL